MMLFRNKKIDKNGFTLIEVIISIAILAVVTTGFLWIFVNASNLENISSNKAKSVNYIQYYSETFLNNESILPKDLENELQKTITWSGPNNKKTGHIDEGDGYETKLVIEKFKITFEHAITFPEESTYNVKSGDAHIPKYVEVGDSLSFDATYNIFYNGYNAITYVSSYNPLVVNIGVSSFQGGPVKSGTKYLQFYDDNVFIPRVDVDTYVRGWKNPVYFNYTSTDIFKDKNTFDIRVTITDNALAVLQDNNTQFYVDSQNHIQKVRYFFPEKLLKIDGDDYSSPKHIKFDLYKWHGHSSYIGDRIINYSTEGDENGEGDDTEIIREKMVPYSIRIESYHNNELIDSTEIVRYYREL